MNSTKRKKKMNLQTLKEYIAINIISLEQDLQNEDGADSIVPYLEGAIHVSRHYLELINETNA
jgi:hypothetical protein